MNTLYQLQICHKWTKCSNHYEKWDFIEIFLKKQFLQYTWSENGSNRDKVHGFLRGKSKIIN